MQLPFHPRTFIPRYSAVGLLFALTLVFVSAPLLEDLPRGELIETVLLTLVMISGVNAVGGGHKSLILALVLLGPALAGKWVSYFRPELLHPWLVPLANMVFFAFVITRVLAFIVRAGRVDTNVLCAGISGYLMLGLLWMLAYLALAQRSPHAFNVPSGSLDPFSAFYFSFMTLCTVGYGDITPVSKAARMLAVLEAITGLFYTAVLISRLVSVYSSTPSTPERNLSRDSL